MVPLMMKGNMKASSNRQAIDTELVYSYAKTGTWGQDLYHDLVAPSEKTPLMANTWLSGPGAMPSDCSSPYSVWNIFSLTILDETWKTSQDHSKWAASWDGGKLHLVCIGGINRMEKQKERGGGTVCLRNKRLWEALLDDFKYDLCL